MTKAIDLLITEDCANAILKFTTVTVEAETRGHGSHDAWEHARSYAVEALKSFLRANPHAFDYAARMDKIYQAKQYSKRSA